MRDDSANVAMPSATLVGQVNHTFWPRDDQEAKRPGLHVPWSWLSLSLFVVSVTSLGTLSVIVSVKDVDLLSTIALALAVLAFAAQLIVSLAQAQGSAQQLTQTERVNSQTQSALAEVRSTANALLTNQSDQFNKILSALLRSATEDAVREATEASVDTTGTPPGQVEALDPETVAELVEERVKRLLFSQSNPHRSSGPELRPYVLLSEDLGTKAMEVFHRIGPEALLVFTTMVVRNGVESNSIIITRPEMVEIPALQELTDARLIRSMGSLKTRERYTLTATGKLLASLILGDNFRNAWYWYGLMKRQPPAPE
ncbi:hypothetical protein [Micromonospora sp. KLBMP9576]|uniref:hypothetical protein n=1 Tax=Micromonospora sp. KLBMP9576 TaxID=3424769 RepID=UPI003D89C1DD